MDGKWEVGDIRDAYKSDWIRVQSAEVELPDRSKVTWDVVTPKTEFGSAMTVVSVPDKGTLMLWRYRFITDTWTWELPGASVGSREVPKKTAERSTLEETGWRPSNLKPLLEVQPLSERVALNVHGFIASAATFEGPGRDPQKSADIAWISKRELLALIDKGDVSHAPTLALVLYALSKELIR